MLTTHEKIRTEAGFQHIFTRTTFLNEPDGSAKVFYVTTDDRVKLVPNFGTGATVAGVSDVQVWMGLSGVYGMSQMMVTSVDPDTGAIGITNLAPVGASLVGTYASSPVDSRQIEDIRLQAEGIINQRLSQCYNLPLSVTSSSLTSMASRLASSLLLIRNYGQVSRDTSANGYALYNSLMGTDGQPGEIGLICTPDYQLVDDTGTIIPRNDGTIDSGEEYGSEGYNPGHLYVIGEENFRFKRDPLDTNSRQAGSLDQSNPNIQGDND
jgi:hypothetical protein